MKVNPYIYTYTKRSETPFRKFKRYFFDGQLGQRKGAKEEKERKTRGRAQVERARAKARAS
jgi:hypothetical protein